MNLSHLTFPSTIQPHPTWEVHDASKLKAASTCLRKYFYEYVLGWRKEGPSIHLDFGSAIHLGMEHLSKNLQSSGPAYSQDLIMESYELFLTAYREIYPDPSADQDNSPKDPAGALKVFKHYAKTYSQDSFKVLYTEVSGSTPIDEHNILWYNMDCIIEDQKGISCMDHKTGSPRGITLWEAQWQLDIQIGTYIHGLRCVWPDEQIYGFIVNGLFFYKGEPSKLKNPTLKRVPILMHNTQAAQWLWNVKWLLAQIQHSFEAMSKVSLDNDIMAAWPMQTGNCTKYGVCPYHAFCTSTGFTNPLARCENVQPGFKIEFWDPRLRQSKARIEDGEIKELTQ